MDCPKCGRSCEPGDAICGGCDFILDTSFLGDGFIDDEESKRFNVAPGRQHSSPWSDSLGGDSLILGNLSEHVAIFRTTDSGMEPSRRDMQLYVGSAIQAMLAPHAVPVVQHEVMRASVRLNPFERHVLTLADGTLSVNGIFQQSGLSREELYTALATLTDKGYLKLRDENTVIAEMPRFLAEAEAGSDSIEAEDNATEVSDMAEELRELRASMPEDESADADTFAGEPDVFADEDSGADLHRVDEVEGGATIAELAPQLSAEDLPSNQAEARALAFADGLISAERTNVSEARSSSRSLGSRSGSGRARRAPPPLPKRDEAERRHAEMAELLPSSNPSGGWLVESNPPEAEETPPPALNEQDNEAGAQDASTATAIASAPEGLEGLSVNMSSVFGAGPSEDSAAGHPNAESEDDVFASSPSVAGGEVIPDAGESFVPAVPVSVAEAEEPVTGIIEGAFAEEFPSAIPTQDSQEEVADSGEGDSAPAEPVHAVPVGPPPQANVPPAPVSSSPAAPAPTLSPLPGAGAAPGVAAVFDNVFATGEYAEDVRPAARLDNVGPGEPAEPAEQQAPSAQPAPAAPEPELNLSEAQPAVAPSFPRGLTGRKASPASAVSFEYRRKAEKIFEEAEADFAAGRMGSARMNAKLASIYNPHEPHYGETLKRWEEMSVQSAPPVQPATSPNQRLVENAKRAERQGDYDGAVRLLREALENDPDAAPLLNHLGVILATRMQRYQEASTAIMKAIEINPQNLAYKNNLGKILARQAENDDAKGMGHAARAGKKHGAVMVKNIRPKIF